MQAKDIMSADVITVTPDTALRDVVATLLEHHISGLPVVDRGRVVGMVGESELLHRHEIGTEGERPKAWWERLLGSEPGSAGYVKSHGVRVGDIMSPEVTSVTADASLAELAAIFEARAVRRLPVIQGEKVVGIVTRADLVRALAATTDTADAAATHSDEAIRVRLQTELEKQSWWPSKWCSVFVADGLVRYTGISEGYVDRQAARVAAENVPGVRGVQDDRLQFTDWQPMM